MSKQTTLAIREEVAAKVRNAARESGVSVLELASQLLEAAMEAGSIDFETRRVRINFDSWQPVEEPKRSPGKPKR